MERPLNTRDQLFQHGKRLFWSRGYANVSVREIARAAGVDVAMISRHFGSKRGLFDATLEDAFPTLDIADGDTDGLMDMIVRVFVDTPRNSADPSVVRMMLMNAHDDEVGEHVREIQRQGLQAELERIVGDPVRAALLMAVVLGFSVAEKSLHLDAIPGPETGDYEAQLRHLLAATLAFGQS